MDIKEKGLDSVIWSAVDRFGVQILEFVASVMLARILLPEEFGVVGILMAVIALLKPFVEIGLGGAIVQGKDITLQDIDTAFVSNLILGILIYACLFLSAPLVSNFYDDPKLSLWVRVLGILLLFQSFFIVPQALMSRELMFKELAIFNIIGSLLSSAISIGVAGLGGGVWSLILKHLVYYFVLAGIFFLFRIYRPKISFSYISFCKLYKFGKGMLMTWMLDVAFLQAYPLLIGKFYSPANLAYFNRAKALKEVPSQVISGVLAKVSMPFFAKLQGNDDGIKSLFLKMFHVICFASSFIAAALFLNAEQIVLVLYKEKWIGVVPLLKILAVTCMFIPVNYLVVNLLVGLGRTNYVFKIELVKKGILFAVLLAGISISIKGVALGYSFGLFGALVINFIVLTKVLGFNFLILLKYFLLYAAVAFGSCFLISFAEFLALGLFVTLIFHVVISMLIYLFISALFHLEGVLLVREVFNLYKTRVLAKLIK